MAKQEIFARREYLDILEKRIRDLKDGYRQNIAVIGDESVGKTSILFHLLSNFCDNRIIPVYLEARSESLDSFVKRFIGVLLYNFLINSSLVLQEDLDFLMSKASRFAPRTVAQARLVLLLLSRRKKVGVIPELFSLCEIINSETGKSCVVIIDEFHNLETLGVKNLYAQWCKVLISQKNTMFIITSSAKFKARNILSKNLSLLFGNFEVITVEPFDIHTSEGFIEQRINQAGVILEEGLKNFMVHFTGGSAFYLDLILQAHFKSPEVDLSDILTELLFDPAGALNQRFSNYLKRFLTHEHSSDYISIMHAVSLGHNKVREIAHILHRPQKELSQRISNLLEYDALSRNGDFYSLADRVFSFWLKFVYQEKLSSLTFDARTQKEIFQANIAKTIQDFLVSSKKPVIERIQELLRQFGDETIQIERKRLRLVHFREIKSLDFNKRNIREGLICRAVDALWIIALKPDLIIEDDVAEFAKECKKFRNKTQRKIIITYQGIDSNARLRALEEKIFTWDLNNLNQIFDCFSRPRVIA